MRKKEKGNEGKRWSGAGVLAYTLSLKTLTVIEYLNGKEKEKKEEKNHPKYVLRDENVLGFCKKFFSKTTYVQNT